MRNQKYLINKKCQKKCKIILIGDSFVGKTNIFCQFVNEISQKNQHQITTIDFKIKDVTINGQAIKLYVWDTAGQQKYRSIVQNYYKGSQGIILVFDVTNQITFKNAINQWFNSCRLKSDAIIVLAANKIDLVDNKFDQFKISQWCVKNNIKYYKVSAKTGFNVTQIFMNLVQMIIQKDNKVKQEIKAQFQLEFNREHTKNKYCC